MGPIEVGFSRSARALQSEAIAIGFNAGNEANYEFPVTSRPQVRAVVVIIPPQDSPQQIDGLAACIPPGIQSPCPGLRVAIVSTSAALQGLTQIARQIAFVNLNGTTPGTASTIPFGAVGLEAGVTANTGWLAPTPWPTDWIVRYEAYQPLGVAVNVGQVPGGLMHSPQIGYRPGAGLILGPGEGALCIAGHAYPYRPGSSGALTAATRTETVLSLAVYGGALSQGQFNQASATDPNVPADVARALAKYGMIVEPPTGGKGR